jgi:hypothetical protein
MPVQEEPGVYRPAERTGRHHADPEPETYQPGVGAPVDPFPAVAAPPQYPEPGHPHEERHRSRLPLLVLAVVAVAAVVAAAVIAGVAFLGPRPTPAPPETVPSTAGSSPANPSLSASAPGNLSLRDQGDTVTLMWTDPSKGTVPFFVEVGQAGTPLRIMGHLAPGETTYPVVGLNPRLDYCFSVVAVYSAALVAPSNLVCTQRSGAPGASPTR